MIGQVFRDGAAAEGAAGGGAGGRQAAYMERAKTRGPGPAARSAAESEGKFAA